MAVLNKSLARNNKLQDRGQKRAGDGGGVFAFAAPENSAPNADCPAIMF